MTGQCQQQQMQRGDEIGVQIKDQIEFMQFAWRFQTGQIWMMQYAAPLR